MGLLKHQKLDQFVLKKLKLDVWEVPEITVSPKSKKFHFERFMLF
jgi:hypothetical protein